MTKGYEIEVSSSNVSSVSSLQTNIHYAGTLPPKSIFWRFTGTPYYRVWLEGVHINNTPASLQVQSHRHLSELDSEIILLDAYSTDCEIQSTTGLRDIHEIEVTSTTNNDSCMIRSTYVPKNWVYPVGDLLINNQGIDAPINESLVRILPSEDYYSCSKSSCVTLQRQSGENSTEGVQIYDDIILFTNPTTNNSESAFSTSIRDAHGGSVYINLLFEPGDNYYVYRTAILVLGTILLERLIRQISIYLSNSAKRYKDSQVRERRPRIKK